MVTKKIVEAQVSLKESTKEGEKVKMVDQQIIDKNPEDADKGEIGFNLSMRVPNTMGQYSSTEIGVFLKGPGDPDKFEAFVAKYADRVLSLQRGLINEILVQSGQKPYFGDSHETQKE